MWLNGGKSTARRTTAAPNADISLAVMHKRAQRPALAPARRSELVNNCAASHNRAGARPALARSRSPRSYHKMVSERLPAEPVALAPTSDRKKPREGHYISSMDGRAKRRKNQPHKKQTMNDSEQWQQYRAFGGLDWASQQHCVVVVNQAGKVIEEFEIEHSALGWKKFREKLQPYGSIPFAIETTQGVAVEQLLEAGMIVYPLNPKSAQAYRERKAPSGVKDDWLDAWSFADALRVDGHGWKALRPEEPLIKELRLLCRDEVSLIEQRTAFIEQLRHALAEYYPAALEAFEDWTSVSAWMFLQRFPSPDSLAQAGKRKWQNFLHSRRLWGSEQGPRRMEIFARACQFASSPPTTKAKSLLALSLVQMLFAVEKQLVLYRQRIEELFARHPDHDLFGSLPGAGPKIAPRLLSEIGDDRQRFGGDAQKLQCLAGSAPVTKRSGKQRKYWHVHQRWACDKYLRHALHLFSEQSLSRCVWAELYYQRHRQKNQSHANALRRLANRWLKIIHKMWMERTPYNAELHHRNQLQHGSWIFQLKNT
jgi:transposase/transposase IS116/IS110/IS902 family protein